MQSPKLQSWRRIRDHLHTPRSSTFLSTRQVYPWQVALQQSLIPFNLTNAKMRKYIFRDPEMPKKKLNKMYGREATPLTERKMVQTRLELYGITERAT